MTIFYLRLTSVNWCGMVTINDKMYREKIPGALLCTKPASMRNLRAYFSLQLNLIS